MGRQRLRFREVIGGVAAYTIEKMFTLIGPCIGEAYGGLFK